MNEFDLSNKPELKLILDNKLSNYNRSFVLLPPHHPLISKNSHKVSHLVPDDEMDPRDDGGAL